MSDYYLKAGSTAPALQATLIDENSEPVNLTGATVTLRRKSIRGGEVEEFECEIVGDEEDGVVKYEWQEDENETAGQYFFDFEILMQDGTVVHCPNTGDKLVMQITAGP